MAGRIATISGTMLTPGVSRNGRLYTAELIASAAKRMQDRIADPDALPITVRTHHDAGDDSSRIIGRIAKVTVEKDGSATYAADLYDTTHGRDIAALVTGKQPALRSVSIHGWWMGPVKRVAYEGQQVSTADDLEIDSVDLTATPGVPGAKIASAAYLKQDGPAESARRVAISESAEATLAPVTEEAPLPPVRSKAALRRAVGEAATPRARVYLIDRAAALGLTHLIPSTWKDGSMAETATRYSDVREYYDGPGGAAGFCIDAYNGPTSITIRNCTIDPAELRVIAAAAMDAIVNALQQLDPDMDADIDLDGAPNADTDGDAGSSGAQSKPASGNAASRETTAPAPMPEAAEQASDAQALTETTPPDLGEAATPLKEEPAVSEPTTQETAAPARSLTDADLAALGALFGAALKESMAPVAKALKENVKKDRRTEAAETAPAPEVDAKAAKKAAREQAIRDAVVAQVATETTRIRDELREQLLRENGLPGRRGYRLGESDQPAAPEAADLFKDRASLLLGDYGITPQPAQ